MKSSNQKSFLSNSSTYSLLAIFTPLALLAAFIFLAQILIDIKLPSVLFIISGFIGALSASFYCDFMKDKKSSRTQANIRGAIISMAVSYLIISPFLFEIHRQERFIPNLYNVLSCICTLYTWSNVISLKKLFKARKYFEEIMESYKNEDLQEILFGDSALVLYTSENIDNIWQNHIFQLVLVFVLTFACTAFKIHIPLALYLLLAVILSNGVFIFGFFEIIKREHYCASEGINPSEHGRIWRILSIYIFIIFCFFAAFFFTSDKNILPVSIITGFFIILFSLIGRFSFLINNSREPVNTTDNYIQQAYNFPEEVTVSPIIELIIKYGLIFLKYSLIILATALFIKFMISPLLNRGEVYKEMTFTQRLIYIIKEWYNGILAAIHSIINNLKNFKARMKLDDKEKIRRASENISKAYSPAKKHDIYRSITLFARLIVWGSEKRNVKWKPTLAPGEYCTVLSSSLPVAQEIEAEEKISLKQQNEGIIRCGEIFEKAIYSAKALSSLERKEYKKLVESITSC